LRLASVPPASPCSSSDINLVDRGELEDELHSERTLVALDQVEIGRRNAERLGHRRLGQALGVADAADPRTGEYLLFSHRPIFTGFYRLSSQSAEVSLLQL
jgi:hypothetical protein